MTYIPSTNFPIECPSCGAGNVASVNEVEHFKYGEKEDAPTLSALICVHHCASCDFSFTTEDASESRHEAICRYLNVLTPTEVREVREHYALSQADFAELTKIGKASLGRWETGVLIQNQANDNLLYLLTFHDNFTRLKDRVRLDRSVSTKLPLAPFQFQPKFRALPEADVQNLQRDAEVFQLFPSQAYG